MKLQQMVLQGTSIPGLYGKMPYILQGIKDLIVASLMVHVELELATMAN